MLWPTSASGSSGMLAANDVEERLEIVEQLAEAGDVAARALGAAVTALVVGVDGAVARREPGADVVVATAVLGEAVHEQRARAADRSVSQERRNRRVPVGGAKLRLDAAD